MENETIEELVGYLGKIGNRTRFFGRREMTVSEIAQWRAKNVYGHLTKDVKLILVNACLAWRNPFVKKVKPRLIRVEKRFPDVQTLEGLRDLMERLGDDFNVEFWDFKSERRKEMLRGLVTAFIEYKKRNDIQDDFEAIRHWATQARPEEYQKGIDGHDVTCLGLANFQYLRMLCGVDTIKPDKHIMDGVAEALGFPKQGWEVIKLAEQAAKQMGKSVLEIDQLFWVSRAVEIPPPEWYNE